MEKELERGNLDLFLYPKVASARFFHDLGFYEIARVPDCLVFMENQSGGFAHCLDRFKKETQTFLDAHGLTLCKDDPISAIVMNAPPSQKYTPISSSRPAARTSSSTSSCSART